MRGLLTAAVKKRLGLLLDQYDRHFCAQVFCKEWLSRAGELTKFLQDHFKPAYFILKDRARSGSLELGPIRTEILIDEGGGSKAIVREYDVKFEVDLNDGLNTGLFLDMRANRHAIGQMARNKRMLNCFACTCSFGAHARAHGAREVVNVDVSKKALERGRV